MNFVGLRRLLPHSRKWLEVVADDQHAFLSFEAGWYLKAYPDAGREVEGGRHADAISYYRRLGIDLGHDPNPYFFEAWYRSKYPDVASSIAQGTLDCGFQHFLIAGFEEGRRCNGLVVDEDWYRTVYVEVETAISEGRCRDAHEHYLLIGAKAGHDPHPAFSETWYRRTYAAELGSSLSDGRYLSGYHHFLDVGLDAGLRPHPAFSEVSYRHRHADVDETVLAGRARSGYHHLITIGLAEGREWRSPIELEVVKEAATRRASIELQAFLARGERLDLAPLGEAGVSVVIVVYNRAELTLRCLSALSRVTTPCCEVIVVDNGSSDLTEDLLAQVSGVKIVRPGRNLGFVDGSNLGAKEASAGAVLLLNNDAEVEADAIGHALTAMRAGDAVGAVGGCLLRLDGRVEEAGAVVWRDGATEPVGAAASSNASAVGYPRTVDYCSGAFLLVDRQAFEELGGFSQAYCPAYYEDVDLCFRLREKLGLNTMYEPRALVWHFGSASLTRSQAAEDLCRENRLRFTKTHATALRSQPPAGELLSLAGDRSEYRARLLVIDDRWPDDLEGSGYPRMGEILHALHELGFFVTFYTSRIREPGSFQHGRHGLELVDDLGVDGFGTFFQARGGEFDRIIVSRLHNLAWFRHQLGQSTGIPVTYDAEGLVFPRVVLQQEVLGHSSSEGTTWTKEEELSLIGTAQAVWAASGGDAETLQEHGIEATVVGHATEVSVARCTFKERQGLLFVGRLAEQHTPNVVGLRWFLDEVLPLIRSSIASSIPVTIVGRVGEVDLPTLENVDFVGQLHDLPEVCAQARLFVAPALFAAGIPLKILTAASFGLPVVASHLLIEQLGWRNGLEIVDGGNGNAEEFAQAVVATYQDEPAWKTLQQAASERIRVEFSRAALEQSLKTSLKD